MGLFDFVTNAGEKLSEKILGKPVGHDVADTVEVSPQRLNQLRAENITKMLAALDIEGEQVSVTVDGDKAVLKGSAPSQEALEKMVLCAGNQFGISQVDCQLEVDGALAADSLQTSSAPAAARAEAKFYTVKSGDTLGKIAQEHYGSASKYTVIFEANQPMLSDPDKIYVGQSLRIPAL